MACAKQKMSYYRLSQDGQVGTEQGSRMEGSGEEWFVYNGLAGGCSGKLLVHEYITKGRQNTGWQKLMLWLLFLNCFSIATGGYNGSWSS